MDFSASVAGTSDVCSPFHLFPNIFSYCKKLLRREDLCLLSKTVRACACDSYVHAERMLVTLGTIFFQSVSFSTWQIADRFIKIGDLFWNLLEENYSTDFMECLNATMYIADKNTAPDAT